MAAKVAMATIYAAIARARQDCISEYFYGVPSEARNWYPLSFDEFSAILGTADLLVDTATLRRKWRIAIADGVIGTTTDSGKRADAGKGFIHIPTLEQRTGLNLRTIPPSGGREIEREIERDTEEASQ